MYKSTNNDNDLLDKPIPLKDILFTGVSDDWRKLLDTEELDDILEILTEEKGIVPGYDKIFEFARLTKLSKIKVVILGQDPYPTAGDAHGLAFSCLTCIPNTLRNIYKCLIKTKLINEMPTIGNLTYWAEQGVLLLNSSLTARVGKSNAHCKIWVEYTDGIIKKLSHMKSETNSIKHYKIFMLWGKDAKKKRDLIHDKCKIMEWSHPSPNAVAAGYSFDNCDHFIRANKMLKRVGIIDWNVSAESSEVEKTLQMTSMKTVVFTDGSCNPNKLCPEAVAGYAAIFVLGQFMDTVIYGNLDNSKHYASNQRAEGMAIYQALMFLLKHVSEWESVIFISDSDFWINMIETYMPNWAMCDIDFNDKKNSDLTIPMWKVYTQLIHEFGKEIELRHVRSHNKNGWKDRKEGTYERFCYDNNDLVDQFAGYARKNIKKGNIVIERLDVIDE